MFKLYRNTNFYFTRLFFCCFLFLVSSHVLAQTTYIVNSTADSPDADLSDAICADSNGECTLRAAIQNANRTPAKDKVHFNIAGPGPHNIELSQNLPVVVEAIELDATTQPGYNTGAPLIVVVGTNVPLVPNGSPDDQVPTGFLLDGNSAGSTIKGFVIGGFGRKAVSSGIAIRSKTSHNIIQSNFIGVAADGVTLFQNVWGIMLNAPEALVGGENAEDRNIIAGNSSVGVHLGNGSSNCLITGNYVGTSADGNSTIANYTGINVTYPSFGNRIEHNVIGGCTQGIHLSGGDNTVVNNSIGLNPVSGVVIPNEYGLLLGSNRNIVGTPGKGNVISGNYVGVYFTGGSLTTENKVSANFIGTDKDGENTIPNSIGMVLSSNNTRFNVIGGKNQGEGNIVSGNLETGILLRAGTNNNTLLGNWVGTKSDGKSPLPNKGNGISIEHAFSNRIGGTEVGERNTIAFNGGHGILMQDIEMEEWNIVSTRNRISGNQIFDNAGLGIDLNGDGVTANDRDDIDEGPNRLQNFPEISKDPTYDGTELALSYHIPSNAKYSAYPITVEFYIADNTGQGKLLLYADTFTESDSKGKSGKPKAITVKDISLAQGTKLVATATDAQGNTSEFGVAIEVQVTDGCTNPVTYYADADGDGYGVDDPTTNLVSCEDPGAGYATKSGDCNDTDATINPGADEIPGDGIDQNCDGADGSDICVGTDVLSISELCSYDPATERRWLIHNPSECEVTVRWEVQKVAGGGTVVVSGNGSVEVTTGVATKGPTKVTFYWNNSSGVETKKTLTSSGSKCATSATLSSNLMGSDSLLDKPFQVYPNPMTADGLWLEFAPAKENVAYQGYVYDLSGRMMAATRFEVSGANRKHYWELDHNTWSHGVYFLIIKNNEQSYRFKIVK